MRPTCREEWNKLRLTRNYICVLLALVVAVLTAPLTYAAGTLVIVGGALNPDHAAVYQAFLDAAGAKARIAVLPTASGVPERSGPLTVQDFQQYAEPTQSIELVYITQDDQAAAQSESMAAYLKQFDGIWFTGGDQSRILNVFRPIDEEGNVVDTLGYEALKEVLQRGGVVGGTSAGAAMMSDPMIKWGNSHEAFLVGRSDLLEDWGVGVTRGMGFFPFGMVDQHFFRRGRLGRLMVACETESMPIGIGVAENTAMVVDLAAKKIKQVVGEKGVLVVERDQPIAPRSAAYRADWRAWRAWHLKPGDTMTFKQTQTFVQVDADSTKAAAPTVELFEQAIKGAPRRYDGPLVMAFEINEHNVVLTRTAAYNEIGIPTRERFNQALAERKAEEAAKGSGVVSGGGGISGGGDD